MSHFICDDARTWQQIDRNDELKRWLARMATAIFKVYYLNDNPVVVKKR